MNAVTQLPIRRIGLKNYYVDARLAELRNTEDPFDRVSLQMLKDDDDTLYNKLKRAGWDTDDFTVLFLMR